MWTLKVENECSDRALLCVLYVHCHCDSLLPHLLPWGGSCDSLLPHLLPWGGSCDSLLPHLLPWGGSWLVRGYCNVL